MTTPPRVTDLEVNAALARIERRHRHLDDPCWSEAGTSPRDVFNYILSERCSRLPRAVGAADAADGAVLWARTWWQDRETERRFLRHSRHVGASLANIGARLGIRTPQGVQDRIDRLDALVAHGRPDGHLSRARRRVAATSKHRGDTLTQHKDLATSVVAALLAQVARALPSLVPRITGKGPGQRGDADCATAGAEDATEWLDELAADYLAETVTPATLVIASLAVAELRVLPEVAALDEHHRLHRALRDVDLLRSKLGV